MAAHVTVIAGPARSGKTTGLLDQYRQRLRQEPIGSLLWLAPTRRAAFTLRGRLLTSQLAGCFSPGVMTFDQFAQAVLQASTAPVRSIQPAMKRHLVRGLIAEAHRTGRLKHFAPIADTPGLVDLVDQWISELKRLEIWPEDFRAACQQRGLSRKDGDLLDLYERYQAALTKHQLYDAEGCFWSARALLRQGQQRPFDKLRHVVADGFTDFTRTQHEILEILAERVQTLCITLPLEPSTGRQDLFAKSQATFDEFERRHRQVEVRRSARPATSAWPAATHLEAELFKSPRSVKPLSEARGISILAAPRLIGELREIARRIKDLLTIGDGGALVKPSEIAVVFRSLTEAGPMVEEVFTEFGIPTAIESDQPLGRSPALAWLVALLQLDRHDWPFRQALAVLGSNYFDPAWPEWQEAAVRGTTERLLRDLQIPDGREALLAEIERCASSSQGSEADDDQRRPQRFDRQAAAQQVGPLLKRLKQCLSQLPQRATLGEWSLALDQLAAETGFLAAIDATARHGRASPDRVAWERLQQALASADELAAWLEEEPAALARGELLDSVLDILGSERLPAQHDETGRVRVLSAHSARTLEVPYLFFAGLSEKGMPSPEREDRLYSETECRRLRELGLPLVLHNHRSQEEMLLFYEVVTRAGRFLQLSYPALDEKAQPLLASPYIAEVERVFEGAPGLRRELVDLSPMPTTGEPSGASELRLRAVQEALDGNCALLAGLSGQKAAAGLAENLLGGLQVLDQRSQREGFGAFEGVLSAPAIAERLLERFGDDHLWSASQLEQYARCPFQFYLEQVLGIAAPGEIALETDFGERGRSLHRSLAEIHRRINQAHKEPVSPAKLKSEQFAQTLGEVLDLLYQLADDDRTLPRALKEIDRRMLSRWLALYQEQHRQYDAQWERLNTPLRPAHFEVSFGLPIEENVDNCSTKEPLELHLEGLVVKLAGRIDRIDLGTVGGRFVFNIVDYKSGRTKSPPKEVTIDGTALQLELYAIAAKDVLLASLGAEPLEGGYWFIKEKGYKRWFEMSECSAGNVEPSAAWEERRRRVFDKVGQIVRGIRSARFPVFSLDDQCTSHCQYRTVCRINHVRSLEKTWVMDAVDNVLPLLDGRRESR